MMQNSAKVWTFIIVFSLAHLFVGYEVAGRMGLFFGLVAAISFHLLVFYYGDNHLLQRFQASRVEGQDSWGILELVQKYAEKAGIPAPRVYVANNKSCFAFTVGTDFKNSGICLSSTLLKKMKPADLEAIIAHQICHISRYGNFWFSVTSVLANTLMGMAEILDAYWFVNLIKKQQVQKPFVKILLPFAWSIIRLTVPRRNYLENDDLAASILGDRKSLAEAIWKLESYSNTLPLEVPPCTQHLFIVNPEGQLRRWWLGYHPASQFRIQRLIGYYPI